MEWFLEHDQHEHSLQLACTSRNTHRSDVFALIDVSSCLLEGCNIQQGT